MYQKLSPNLEPPAKKKPHTSHSCYLQKPPATSKSHCLKKIPTTSKKPPASKEHLPQKKYLLPSKEIPATTQKKYCYPQKPPATL
ncbi:hypothetical protein AVEN_245110-1 [Araneus ventricosus]|uniref:Uncharacterized protein n=1 Tax=Araneus ventricosus TaxID=182803 RepID=A0A4Y2PGP0_ARAVE|nr:hypothetical protein AVEN_245110-1 [Araneus ventricosus]